MPHLDQAVCSIAFANSPLLLSRRSSGSCLQAAALYFLLDLSNWCVVTQVVISPILPMLSMLDLNCEPSVLNSLNATFSSTILLVAPSCCCSSEGILGGLRALT